MKKLLLLFLFFTAFANAQSGSISIVSIPTEANPGQTFDVTFEYTSDVVGTYELQFVPLGADDQPIWGQNVTYTNEPTAINETAAQVTVSITLPEDITLTADLTSPAVSWGLFGKIAGSAGDIAYLGPYPKVNVIAAGSGGGNGGGEVVTPAGTIAFTTLPTDLAKGATFDVTFEYTSNVTGVYELQFIPMGEDGQPVWSMENKAFASAPIAVNETATPVTVSMSIPDDITLTTDLASPAVAWGLFGKIANSSGDIAYAPSYPLVNVTETGSGGGEVVNPAGTISILSFPTELAKGATFDVTFEYTSNVTGVYELQFIPMGEDGQPVWSMENKAFASAPIAVNETATPITVSMSIPDDITLTADLESPAVAWGLFGKITDGTNDIEYISPYPQANVVATLSLKNNVFDANTIFYNSTAKTLEINTENMEAKSLQIYNISGKNVLNISNAKNSSRIDVSSLAKGIYIVKSEAKYFKFLKR
ncbi:T9SS type A sorting domain-containing protein [uncultured Polaribacter sp.]|uniref:T9SS type A sorting domain-containing protein n=1 Tax=uncultured Polaribacter sp. TaxID=174711 RepID=UPI0026329DAD|nr:T9SS type A sorting domain-containing protein [uncultured Polaribacter sp.]